MAGLRSLFSEVARYLARAPADAYTFHETADYKHADVLRGTGQDTADDPENGREDDGRFTTESVANMACDIRAEERTARHGYDREVSSVSAPLTAQKGPDKIHTGGDTTLNDVAGVIEVVLV